MPHIELQMAEQISRVQVAVGNIFMAQFGNERKMQNNMGNH
jgi:hypothetical protein